MLILLVQNVDIENTRSRKLQSVTNTPPPLSSQPSNFNPNFLIPQNTFTMQPPPQNSNILIQSPYFIPMNPNINPNVNPNTNINPNTNPNTNPNYMQQVNPFLYQMYAPNPNLPQNAVPYVPPAAPYPIYYNPNPMNGMNGGSIISPPTSQSPLPLPLISEISAPFLESDIPYYWHIPKVGGSTLKNIFSSCYDLKRPNRSPAKPEDSLELLDGKFVNVDTATTEGIAKAKELGLIPAKVTDVVISPRIYEVQTLFNQFQRPRMFTMFRHPFSRLFSFFNYHKHATWENKHSSFEFMKNMTFEEYLRTRTVENNWLTCTLTNTDKKEINETHVQLATDILARKCLVGMTEEFNTSVYRFQQYFNWKVDESRKGCLKRLIFDSPVNKLSNVLQQRDPGYQIEKLEEGDPAWNLLLETNKYDLQLYENAKKIFQDQAKYFPNLV